MSTTTRILSAAALFISSVAATFTSPDHKTKWDVNTEHKVQWGTGGLEAPLQLHLCPGGSKGVEDSIVELARELQKRSLTKYYF